MGPIQTRVGCHIRSVFSGSCGYQCILSDTSSISTKKTEVMHQPAPLKAGAEPTITVNTQKLSTVDRFTYLGSILSRAVHTDDEVDTRIARASAAFGIFPSNVWERRGISLETKLKVYTAVMLPSLLYARETWTVHSRHAEKLKHLHMSYLRKLIKITLVK